MNRCKASNAGLCYVGHRAVIAAPRGRVSTERIGGPGLAEVLAEVAYVSSYLEEEWLTRREIDVIENVTADV